MDSPREEDWQEVVMGFRQQYGQHVWIPAADGTLRPANQLLGLLFFFWRETPSYHLISGVTLGKAMAPLSSGNQNLDGPVMIGGLIRGSNLIQP